MRNQVRFTLIAMLLLVYIALSRPADAQNRWLFNLTAAETCDSTVTWTVTNTTVVKTTYKVYVIGRYETLSGPVAQFALAPGKSKTFRLKPNQGLYSYIQVQGNLQGKGTQRGYTQARNGLELVGCND